MDVLPKLMTGICFQQTAIMMFGAEELHLVAMYSRDHDKQYPCFWGFNVAMGLYNSCLVMLNLRCLGIVFDLDETLVVANTMRSFEDRIEALQRKISTELDQQRASGMQAEVKRYQDDKLILKQYAENDQIIENGKVIKSQSEVVPALSGNHQPIVRPILRLYEKNIILTRINPQVTRFCVPFACSYKFMSNDCTGTMNKTFLLFFTLTVHIFTLLFFFYDPFVIFFFVFMSLVICLCICNGNA